MRSFGHRRDREIYKGLEADRLTLEEREACDEAALLWLDGGFAGHRCVDMTDPGDDGG